MPLAVTFPLSPQCTFVVFLFDIFFRPCIHRLCRDKILIKSGTRVIGLRDFARFAVAFFALLPNLPFISFFGDKRKVLKGLGARLAFTLRSIGRSLELMPNKTPFDCDCDAIIFQPDRPLCLSAFTGVMVECEFISQGRYL